jgi:hypothetical protein
MLAGLLLLCLMAPRYWRSNSAAVTTNRTEQQRLVPQGAACLPFGWEEQGRWSASPGQRQEFDPLNLWAAPTIEELVAARTGIHPLEEQPFRLPVIVLSGLSSERERTSPAATSPVMPGPLATATLERFGRMLVDYTPSEALPRLSAKVVDVFRLWATQPVAVSHAQRPAAEIWGHKENSPSPSTLRILAPGDRFAIVPPQSDDDAERSGHSAARRHDESPAKAISDRWCVPQVLLDQLQRLAHHPDSAIWAEQTISQIVALTARDRLDGDDVQSLLAALSDSAEEAARLADATGEDRLRVELLRAHWGLARRLDCWTALHDIRVAERTRDRVALHGPLESFFNGRPAPVVETIHRPAFNVDLETYERSRDPQFGRRVVRQQRVLEASADPLDRSLAESVERHYRNANVRVAITAEFLNRLVAQDRSDVQALRDRIAGTPVRGQSHTQSESRVRLDPAAGRWQMTVEADGLVDSHTLVDGGAARLRSHSATDFAARKSVLVDPQGVQLQRTVVDATNRNRLVGVTTDFDWVPLLGSFARERAVSQYHARRERAKTEIEFRVSNQAVDQLDRETRDAVQRIERQVRERLTDRLAKAGVGLTPIQMATTHDRVVGRFRLAGNHQLGSHTPRPRALSDSLASVQVHETALTNAAVTLSLDGGRYSGPELQRLLRETFPRMGAEHVAPRHDAVFHFAQEDAVQFHIDDGRLELALTLAGVEQGSRTMRDFIVHAYYVPVVNGLEAELARDGSLGIEGRLSSAERARLHNVFDSVLPPERTLPIVRLDNPDDPRLAGLMITQLVLEDGWLGLAVGPILNDRTAERSRSLR